MLLTLLTPSREKMIQSFLQVRFPLIDYFLSTTKIFIAFGALAGSPLLSMEEARNRLLPRRFRSWKLATVPTIQSPF